MLIFADSLLRPVGLPMTKMEQEREQFHVKNNLFIIKHISS
jgi:hypothetical protein